MITIDGSTGEGGGQILRTSLALSMITGQPFRIERLRAGRDKPGLLRQHLTAVHAATSICDATVNGASIGSQSLTFTPRTIRGGEYTFSVGTAGSATLVLQTVLPALMNAAEPSSLTLEGGTHNPYAPPFDFVDRVYVPLINRMGPTIHLTLERAGFYPAGGGRFFAQIQPAKLSPLHLTERGEILERSAKAIVAALPGRVARRELDRVEKMLGWSGDQLQIRQLPDEWGPGNALMIEIQSEHVTEIFTSFGSKGVTSEAVGDDASRQTRKYLADGVPVGTFLADQLVLPLALAGGGSFLTHPLSMHSKTNIDIIRRFLPVQVAVAEQKGGTQVEILS